MNLTAEFLSSHASSGGRPVIIIVEREDGVRVVLTRWLQRQGFTVLHAESREAAQNLCQCRQDQLVLMIEDLRAGWVPAITRLRQQAAS
jgi:DNA-binding response OmpR family regulator